MRLLIAVAVGLLLTAVSLSQDKPSGVAKEDEYPISERHPAKVELAGQLGTDVADRLVILAGNYRFRLDLSLKKELQGKEAWAKLKGKGAIVRGALGLPGGEPEILVSSLRLANERQ